LPPLPPLPPQLPLVTPRPHSIEGVDLSDLYSGRVQVTYDAFSYDGRLYCNHNSQVHTTLNIQPRTYGVLELLFELDNTFANVTMYITYHGATRATNTNQRYFPASNKVGMIPYTIFLPNTINTHTIEIMIVTSGNQCSMRKLVVNCS